MRQQLALLKGFDFDSADPVSADFVHRLVECSKLAYADREKFYGDPDFVQVPMATLLSDAYNDERRKLVSDKASLELRPGRSRASARWSSCVARKGSGARSAAWARASRPSAASARCAAIPCISTSSMRPAIWCRRPRPAAGYNPRP